MGGLVHLVASYYYIYWQVCVGMLERNSILYKLKENAVLYVVLRKLNWFRTKNTVPSDKVEMKWTEKN